MFFWLWVELLVPGALVEQTLCSLKILGWVTSPRALVGQTLYILTTVEGWVTSPRALVGQTFYILTTVEGWVTSPRALVGTNDLKLLISCIETNLVMFGDFWPWGIITGWGLRWLAYGSHGFVFLDVFHEIPHLCFEYGTGVNGWKEYLFYPRLWSGGSWKCHTWSTYAFINKSSFSLVFYS